MPSTPLTVTALLCVYNGARYLRPAIDSILGQTRPVDEILVVDDGSTDGTAAILAGYGDRLRVIRHEDNRGLGAARCTGLAAVRTDLVAFHDADDLWTPRKNELTMRIFEEHPDCRLVFGDMVNFDDETGAARPRTALESATSLDMCVAHELPESARIENKGECGHKKAQKTQGVEAVEGIETEGRESWIVNRESTDHGPTDQNIQYSTFNIQHSTLENGPRLESVGQPETTDAPEPNTEHRTLNTLQPSAFPLDPDALLAALILDCFFHIPTITVRVDAVRAAGEFDPDFRRAQDVDLWYRMAAAGVQAYGVREIFLMRRLHGANLIRNSFAGDSFQARAMARHVERFRRYPRSIRKRLFVRLQGTQRHAAMGALRNNDKTTARRLLRQSFAWRHNPRDLALFAATVFPRSVRQRAGRTVEHVTGRHVAKG